MIKNISDHRQLLGAATRKLTLDEVSIHLDAAGIIRRILSVAVAFKAKSEVCTFKHAGMVPKPGLDFDQQMWPRGMTHDLYKLRFQQIPIGWRA
ncbi:hypothetical protein OAN83_02075 [Alphaproteobacteria bacterium]|nr:hypothetical protein [Alphaproteobacteria bacterium]